MLDGFDFPTFAFIDDGSIIFANENFTKYFTGKSQNKKLNFKNIFSLDSFNKILKNLVGANQLNSCLLISNKKIDNNNQFFASISKSNSDVFENIYLVTQISVNKTSSETEKMEEYLQYLTKLGRFDVVYGDELVKDSLNNLSSDFIKNDNIKNTLTKSQGRFVKFLEERAP